MATRAVKKTKAKKNKNYLYKWVGTDPRGKRVKGQSRAANDAVVRSEMRRQGVVPVKVTKQIEISLGKKSITPADVTFFSRQMATMLSA